MPLLPMAPKQRRLNRRVPVAKSVATRERGWKTCEARSGSGQRPAVVPVSERQSRRSARGHGRSAAVTGVREGRNQEWMTLHAEVAGGGGGQRLLKQTQV
ncbi:hypothetical protein E2C01_060159 [Portunus trituberculatus]|uniref:Uncharacterized protein n=1 Tax=Portunus trituberculatus TaxID=210409 RepID=A0A5B7H7Y9_PORTR|nr:hypothetical protein [Portunus trituberculatus]